MVASIHLPEHIFIIKITCQLCILSSCCCRYHLSLKYRFNCYFYKIAEISQNKNARSKMLWITAAEDALALAANSLWCSNCECKCVAKSPGQNGFRISTWENYLRIDVIRSFLWLTDCQTNRFKIIHLINKYVHTISFAWEE